MSNKSTLTADGAGTEVRATGTLYQLEAEGTFGGGTITPQKQSYSGNWITLGESTLTDGGAINIEIPSGCLFRASLSGATSPNINIHISKIR